MAIDSGLKKSDGGDLGNNLFAGNGTSSGNQTFNIIMKNGVDLGKGWYNKSACYATYGNVGFKNSSGVDVGTLLGKYGTVNCTCDQDYDTCTHDTDGCFVHGSILTSRGLVEISNIVPGDLIWGTDEKWHLVLGIAKNTTGNRDVYTLNGGGIVTSDHVIFSGDCAYVPSLEAWHKSFYKVLSASLINNTNTENIKILGKYSSQTPMQIDNASLYKLNPNTTTFSPICEGNSFIGYLNGHRVLIAGQV